MRYSIILAGGKGTRMKSKEDISKMVFPILGKSLLEYVLDTVDALKVDQKIVVVGFDGESTSKLVGGRAEIVWQKDITGTARAVNECADLLKDKEGDTIILFGDTPLLTEETLNNLFKKHEKYGNDVTLLTAYLEKPDGYARIIRNHKSQSIDAVIDDKDLEDKDRLVAEVATGVYVFNNKKLFDMMNHMFTKSKAEFNLTAVVTELIKKGAKVDSYVTVEQEETFSIADRAHLSYAAKIIRKKINKKWMNEGVSIEDPDRTYISPDVVIGTDTVILPNTYLLGKCVIGEDNMIGPNAVIGDTKIGNGSIVRESNIRNATLGNKVVVEPYAVIEDIEIKDNERVLAHTIKRK